MSDSRQEFDRESSLPNAWDYAYEWDSPMGLRRSFDYRPYNGAKPDRHISLFTEEQMIAHAKAARRAALEEAAKACEERAGNFNDDEGFALRDVAYAIRALAAQTGKNGK